jgi:peptidyl-tRNA hydrolase, PTH1 family
MSIDISKTILIVGLGNPGSKYDDTPHNAGFLVIDKLLEKYGLNSKANKKLHAEIAETEIHGKKIVFAKPTTFMNESGKAIKELVKRYKSAVSSIWLVHDEIDLELGKIKIVKNRGSAGHKGVESAIEHIGTNNFVRFRIGILPENLTKTQSKAIMNKFVTSGFPKKEDEIFKRAIELTKESIMIALQDGIEKSASIYNSKDALVDRP